MALVRYVPDPAFEDLIFLDPQMRVWLGDLADEVARSAETKAPVRTGRLAGDIRGSVEADGVRLVGRVTSEDWKTLLVEHGTRHTHARPFLWPAVYETLPGATFTHDGGRS